MIDNAAALKVNLNQVRRSLSNNKRRFDRASFGRMTNSTVSALAANDLIAIDFLDNSLIDLGAGNDTLNIKRYVRNGFTYFDRFGAGSMINGGSGSGQGRLKQGLNGRGMALIGSCSKMVK